MAEGPADLSDTGTSFLPRASGDLGGTGPALCLAPPLGPGYSYDSDGTPQHTVTGRGGEQCGRGRLALR